MVHRSFKNVEGPHQVYARGHIQPPAFRKGKETMPAGKEFDFMEYGLFEDFEISSKTER